MIRLFLLATALAFSLFSHAQIDGDRLFSENQVCTFELTFEDPNFWTALEEGYVTEEYIAADLSITDNQGTTLYSSVGVRLKGNSSYNHPGNKKSFKIDFNKYTAGQHYDGLKKLNFSNGFKDPSFLREKVFFDVCQEAGVPAPRSNFANVYFNGTLWGFYTIVEQIDDQFLDWRILDDAGNLFKAGDNFGGGPGGGDAAADLVYYGADQSSYTERYELKTNELENNWSDLIDFIDFINNSNDQDFEDQLSSNLELTEYLRSAALDNLFSNLDSYTGSARNYYLYHNLTTLKWEWVKWDGNESFGLYGGMGLNLEQLAPNYHESSRPLLERIFENENLYTDYLEQICYLLSDHFNSENLDPKIDELKLLIQASVYADNNKMYSNAAFDTNIESNYSGGGGPGAETTFGLKSFIANRVSYYQSLLDCQLYNTVENLDNLELKLYPNPVSGELNLEWNSDAVSSITLYDNTGKLVLLISKPSGTSKRLDVRDISPGMYLISIVTNKGSGKTERLIIE